MIHTQFNIKAIIEKCSSTESLVDIQKNPMSILGDSIYQHVTNWHLLWLTKVLVIKTILLSRDKMIKPAS